MKKHMHIVKTAIPVLLAGLTAAACAGTPEDTSGKFVATPLGAGTYGGHQGEVRIDVDPGEKKEIVTVVGDMPVGSKVGFHYHPGFALVAVTKGKVASFDSAKCPASDVYEAGQAFLDFPGHVHDIVNVGKEPAQFVVTFLLKEGEQPLHLVDDPGAGNCHEHDR